MGVQVLVSDPREPKNICQSDMHFSIYSVLLISVISWTYRHLFCFSFLMLDLHVFCICFFIVSKSVPNITFSCRESDMTKERIEKVLKAGGNVVYLASRELMISYWKLSLIIQAEAFLYLFKILFIYSFRLFGYKLF
jgi:hypothetical protein